MERYLAEVVKYAKLAYATGQELRCVVIKRQDNIKWKIYLNKLQAQGVDEIEEED